MRLNEIFIKHIGCHKSKNIVNYYIPQPAIEPYETLMPTLKKHGFCPAAVFANLDGIGSSYSDQTAHGVIGVRLIKRGYKLVAEAVGPQFTRHFEYRPLVVNKK
ncbi:MAG: hypothetical protein NT129_05760 [Candidatus Aenigmarchaeota archaeon]|nr:hypothetical protein [Candidatus Aenigmarchaeota archaeon]